MPAPANNALFRYFRGQQEHARKISAAVTEVSGKLTITDQLRSQVAELSEKVRINVEERIAQSKEIAELRVEISSLTHEFHERHQRLEEKFSHLSDRVGALEPHSKPAKGF